MQVFMLAETRGALCADWLSSIGEYDADRKGEMDV